MKNNRKIYHIDALQCIVDADDAVDILEEFKRDELWDAQADLIPYERQIELSQKRYAIDRLEDWIVERAFEAPVVKIIEDFIYKMNTYAALYAEDTDGYQLFSNMRDVADEIIGKFL